jgi:hypothetical protein
MSNSYDATLLASEAGRSFSISVVAKPKSQTPTIDDNVTYDLSSNCSMIVYYSTDKDASPVHNKVANKSQSTGGNSLRNQLSSEHTIFSDSYTIGE